MLPIVNVLPTYHIYKHILNVSVIYRRESSIIIWTDLFMSTVYIYNILTEYLLLSSVINNVGFFVGYTNYPPQTQTNPCSKYPSIMYAVRANDKEEKIIQAYT